MKKIKGNKAQEKGARRRLGIRIFHLFGLVWMVLLLFGMGVFAAESDSGTEKNENFETVTETVTVKDIAYYDIWKHMDGTWQFGKKPGSTVEASFTIAIGGRLPDGAQVAAVSGRYDDGYAGVYSDAAVPSASVRVKAYTDQTLTYSISAVLTGNPEDIRRDTQSEYTEGYRYYLPAVFDITYTITREKETDPEEDLAPEEEEETDVPELSGQASLRLPETAYEGHSVTAEDRSVFEVDGKVLGAAEMYRRKLAENRFRASGVTGKITKMDTVSANAVFERAGKAAVTLSVRMRDGRQLSDQKAIEILRTPAIAARLSGTQKQNRKQILAAEIAVNPDYPLTELWMEIEQKGGKNRVHLEYDTAGGANQRDNSEMIKTRPIGDDGSNAFFSRVRAEFLTQNEERTEMTYRIFARDSRGHTALTESDFAVEADLAPEVRITAAPEQLREENSNIAYVTAEDSSVSDGDHGIRTWYVREEGEKDWRKASERTEGALRDASSGTWKKVLYRKEGVGKLQFRLEVTDEWTEETLEEYVTPSDRKSGSAEAEVDVINIAPVVSLTAESAKTAKILLLAQDAETKSKLESAEGSLRAYLISHGIGAELQTERTRKEQELNAGTSADSIFTIERPYGYTAEDTFLEKDWYLAAADTLYTVDGTWTRSAGIESAKYYEISAPYEICAYDLSGADENSGAKKWSVQVSGEQLGNAAVREIIGLASDDRGKYLFFRTNEKTLCYDGRTGTYIAALPLTLGEENYAEDNRIYTIREDGLFRIDLQDGTVRRIWKNSVCMKDSYCDSVGTSRRINGKICFFSGSGKTLRRVSFSPESENLRFSEVTPSGSDYSSTYRLIGFGADGRAALSQDGKSRAYLFAGDGSEISTFSGWDTADACAILPAWKSDGNFDYLAVIRNSHTRSGSAQNGYKQNYKADASVYGGREEAEVLSFHAERKVSESASSGNGTDAERAMYAVDLGNKIVLCTGDFATSLSDGTPISSYYNTSFSQIVFDLEGKTVARTFYPTEEYAALQIGGSICEYGKVTEDYVISAYSRNSAAYAYGEEINRQALRVSRLPRAHKTAIAQTIDRFAVSRSDSGADLAAVILIGKTADENGEFRLTESLQRCENRFFEVGPGEDSAGPAAIFALIREAGERKGILTVRSDADGPSEIRKTYRLKPDTTYYYELEYRGAKSEEARFGAVPRINEALTETAEGMQTDLTGNSFSVIQLEKEDFSDAEKTEIYFRGLEKSRFHQGKYYGAEMLFAKDKGANRVYKDQSSISFEVPEDGVSILQFDYEMKGRTGAPDEVYIDINGVRWYRNVNLTAESGTYTHPEPLPAGENKIEFGARFYGTRPAETFIAIDNLKVLRLTEDSEWQKTLKEDSAGVLRKIFDAETDSAEAGKKRQGVFQTVKGSLTTPPEILSYTGQEAEVLDQAPDAPPRDFIVVKTGNNQKNLAITVPEGKKALHTAVTLHSSPAAKYPVRWSVDGKEFQARTSYAANEAPAEISEHFRVNSLRREGTLEISPGSLYKRGAGYDRIEMIFVQNLYGPAESGKYFAGKTDEVFLEDRTFDGTVDFYITGSGIWEVADFRLYHIENGVRIYEKDTALENFEVSGGTAAFEVRTEENVPEEQESIAKTVYRKGETIPYQVTYRDYEGDSSKAQYWRYTHIPANDGMHPDAGKVLPHPIERFYVDGKYTAEHWQEDQTGRTDYDKLSNTAELTFYIEGGEGAPWITGIRAQPLPLRTKKAFSLKIGVDDAEKDVLSLTTEVYKDGKRLYQHQKNGIIADKTGKYPLTLTDPLIPEWPGRYQVVCVVRDESGSGLGTESFWISASAEIKGKVTHFPVWERERLAYNKAHPEELRAENVFWSMEAFCLEAEVTSPPQSVTAEIREYPGKAAALTEKSDGRYEGSFFNKAISADLAEKCRKNPGGLTTLHMVFTAKFSDGTRAEDTVPVLICEDGSGRIRIHRVY